jgi:hypothetical protein
MFVSQKFVDVIKTHPAPAYRLAIQADVKPYSLYKKMIGIASVKANDPEIIRVGELVGLKAHECFSKELPLRL